MSSMITGYDGAIVIKKPAIPVAHHNVVDYPKSLLHSSITPHNFLKINNIRSTCTTTICGNTINIYYLHTVLYLHL